MKMTPHEDLIQVEVTNRMFGLTLLVSVYYMDGLLIDTGSIKKKDDLTPLFKEWDIDHVIVTHHHEDHTGLAYWLQEHKGVPIYSHPIGVEKSKPIESLPLYRRVFWGPRQPYDPAALTDSFRTRNYTWDIIHTPGHAKDHIALFNREKKWMFGGDLYVHPTPKSMFSFESVPQSIESLRKILTYDFDTYICSHAGIIPNGRRAIQHKLTYLLTIEEKVLALHEQGVSPQQIRKKLLPNRHPIHYLSFFENSPKHMINSIIK